MQAGHLVFLSGAGFVAVALLALGCGDATSPRPADPPGTETSEFTLLDCDDPINRGHPDCPYVSASVEDRDVTGRFALQLRNVHPGGAAINVVDVAEIGSSVGLHVADWDFLSVWVPAGDTVDVRFVVYQQEDEPEIAVKEARILVRVVVGTRFYCFSVAVRVTDSTIELLEDIPILDEVN